MRSLAYGMIGRAGNELGSASRLRTAGGSPSRALLALLLLAAPAALWSAEPSTPRSTAGSVWTAADFDGDSVVDLARVSLRNLAGSVEGGQPEVFRLSRVASLPNLLSRPLATLRARDVDNDQDLDLVLREPLTDRTIGTWLNDGNGVFSKTAAAPSSDIGDELIRYDRQWDDPSATLLAGRASRRIGVAALVVSSASAPLPTTVRPTSAAAPRTLQLPYIALWSRGPPSPSRS